MRERRCSVGTAERTMINNFGIRSCSRFRIGAVCATWPKPWPEIETTRWGILQTALNYFGILMFLQQEFGILQELEHQESLLFGPPECIFFIRIVKSGQIVFHGYEERQPVKLSPIIWVIPMCRGNMLLFRH